MPAVVAAWQPLELVGAEPALRPAGVPLPVSGFLLLDFRLKRFPVFRGWLLQVVGVHLARILQILVTVIDRGPRFHFVPLDRLDHGLHMSGATHLF